MDKEQCLHQFWSSFGIPAYDENTVSPDVSMPYLTYEVATSDEPVSLSASLWYHSTGWADITAKANEIHDMIGRGGVLRAFDEGIIWIKWGHPFTQRMGDPNDSSIRRVRLSINVEYISGD